MIAKTIQFLSIQGLLEMNVSKDLSKEEHILVIAKQA